MPNDPGTNGGGSGGGNGDDGVNIEPTDQVDYARLFLVNLGLSIQAGGGNLAELGRLLSTNSPARRRAQLFGAIEEFDSVVTQMKDAMNVLREQARSLSLDLIKKEGSL